MDAAIRWQLLDESMTYLQLKINIVKNTAWSTRYTDWKNGMLYRIISTLISHGIMNSADTEDRGNRGRT